MIAAAKRQTGASRPQSEHVRSLLPAFFVFFVKEGVAGFQGNFVAGDLEVFDVGALIEEKMGQ